MSTKEKVSIGYAKKDFGNLLEGNRIKVKETYENGELASKLLCDFISDHNSSLRCENSDYRDGTWDTSGTPRVIFSKKSVLPWEGKFYCTINKHKILLDLDADYYDEELTIQIYFDYKDRKITRSILQHIDAAKTSARLKVDGHKSKKGSKNIRTLYNEIEIHGYSWEQFGGSKELREQLKQYVEWPLKNPELFKHVGVKQTKGILLYGPSGTGKTLLAKIIACESKASFISSSPKEITSMWYGQEEKRIGELFEIARKNKPSIVFIDELDGLFTSRNSTMHEATRRALLQLCQELDGIEKLDGVTVLAASNRPEEIDEALRRPGRFGVHIGVPKPDVDGRREIFKIHTKDMALSDDVNLDELASKTDGYTGAGIEQICQRAGYNAIERYLVENKVNIESVLGKEVQGVLINKSDFKIR